ncbi:MAG: ABC transporter permease [Candidatus Sulfotelmatobacter sp.]|jgi:ABC-2 type transport system permease protein
MNTPSNTLPESFGSQGTASTALSATRPFYWSVRRELWEYRSIYLAPLAIAGVILLGFMFVLISLPHTMRTLSSLDPEHQRNALAHPYDVAGGLIMGAAFLVSFFYSIDTLYGERRDRSIFFWKSLPVSDLTTVLAKASVPLLVLPTVAFVITVVTQSVMLLLSSVLLLASGLSVATLWSQLELYQTLLMLLYHLVTVHMLWYAPIYAWLLLVSAWARRTPFLWAILPPLAVGIFEKVAFHSAHFAALVGSRFSGGASAVASMHGDFPIQAGMHLTPGKFLTTPGLWIGLAVAAIFLAAAVRLRRYREPI